jgi:hypothetical protein
MENSKIKSILSDALVIALLTAYSYFVSYEYQRGYYSYFNLPSFLININIENILIAYVSIITFVILIYLIINGITAAIPDNCNPLIVKIIIKYIYFFMIASLYVMSDDKYKLTFYKLFLALFIIFVVGDFILPLFSQKKIEGYKNKVIAEAEKANKANENSGGKYSINRLFMKRLPILPYFIVIFYLSSTIASRAGMYSAKTQDVFTIINDNIVILGTYNNNFIVKEINVEQKTLEPHFYLISNQEDNRYIKKYVGRLIIN